MTLEKILLAVVTGVLVAECCSVCEWTALRLVGWAVRLSYGDAPKGDIRHVEQWATYFDAAFRPPSSATPWVC